MRGARARQGGGLLTHLLAHRLQVGHVFTIEPMICEGTHKHIEWDDNWTAATKDGKRSAQFEHTMVVTESGIENLTARLPTSPPLWWELEAQEAAAAVPVGPASASEDARVKPAAAGVVALD